ncbi:MAG: hypothetical protein VX529_06710 [Pseudomonadota bacterium]|nr:hypothetical protein [Pseudomonadota bacterium]
MSSSQASAGRILACDHCGATDIAPRVESGGGSYSAPRTLTCEDCFPASDTGPCWDDLPIAKPSDAERVRDLVAQSANEMRLAYQCMCNGRNAPAIEHRERAVKLAQEARAINAARTATPEDTQHIEDVPPHKEQSND